jgi:hypothetical protein
MIDEDFRIWLIECNTNPYFGIPNKFIGDLLPRMVSEMFEIILDPTYPPKRKHPLPERNFELIYTPENNTRRPFGTPLYPVREPEKLVPQSRSNVRSRVRRSRGYAKRNSTVAPSKNTSVHEVPDNSKKTKSSVRKNTSFKSNAKDLEKAYLSSGSKTKSPGIKKTFHKLDISIKSAAENGHTITPRNINNAKTKSSLQLSVIILTNELLTGNANGEYKMKSFQMVMNRIYQKISVLNFLLNKSALELKEPKNDYYNSSLPAINEKENMPIENDEHMDLKKIKSDILDPI